MYSFFLPLLLPLYQSTYLIIFHFLFIDIDGIEWPKDAINRGCDKFITLPNTRHIKFMEIDKRHPQIILVLDKSLAKKEWLELPEGKLLN